MHIALPELQFACPHGRKDFLLSETEIFPGRLVAQRSALLSPYRIHFLILATNVVVAYLFFPQVGLQPPSPRTAQDIAKTIDNFVGACTEQARPDGR